MAAPRKLNKALWSNLTRLKLLAIAPPPDRFVLEHSPFDDVEDDDDETLLAAAEKDVYVIIGRIYPLSDMYKETALRIEMKITSAYPAEAPIVRFLTPVHHPNVEADGTFCHQLLNNKTRWSKRGLTTLVEVIRVTVKHIDEPDVLYAVNIDIADEFVNRHAEFLLNASATVKQYFISRD